MIGRKTGVKLGRDAIACIVAAIGDNNAYAAKICGVTVQNISYWSSSGSVARKHLKVIANELDRQLGERPKRAIDLEAEGFLAEYMPKMRVYKFCPCCGEKLLNTV